MRLSKVIISFLAITLIQPTISISEASAGSLLYQQTSTGNFVNPQTLNPTYRISNIEVTVDSDNPDLLITRVNFTGNLKADSFVPYTTTPLLRIKIFKKWTKGDSIDGGFGDIWLDNSTERYPYQNQQIAAKVSSSRYVGASQYDARIDLSGCAARTWIDPSGQNLWIKYSVSMTCIKLPDKFAITAYVDADVNNGYYLDYKFAPLIPMEIDLSSVARPRVKDEQVVKIYQQQNTDLRLTSLNVQAFGTRTDLYGASLPSLPLVYNSLSPAVCTFPNNSQSTLNLISKGICLVEAYAIGDANTKESNRAQMQFAVSPKPAVAQAITTYPPQNMTVGDPDQFLNITTSSQLPVIATSLTPYVCTFKSPVSNPSYITALKPGYCQYRLDQAGNEAFLPQTVYDEFEVLDKVVPKPEPPVRTEPGNGSGSSGGGSSPGIEIGIGGGSNAPSIVVENNSGGVNQTVKKRITCYFILNPKKTKVVENKKPVCPKGYKQKK